MEEKQGYLAFNNKDDKKVKFLYTYKFNESEQENSEQYLKDTLRNLVIEVVKDIDNFIEDKFLIMACECVKKYVPEVEMFRIEQLADGEV